MKSWLVKVAKNTLLDHYKKRKPELFHDESVIENLLIDNQTPELLCLLSYTDCSKWEALKGWVLELLE